VLTDGQWDGLPEYIMLPPLFVGGGIKVTLIHSPFPPIKSIWCKKHCTS